MPSSVASPLPTALFDYNVPEELIAQAPSTQRDGARLLVVDRVAHTISHHQFTELPRLIRKGDTLFRNNAAVLPARLCARRPSGGKVECFLLRPHEGTPITATLWICLLKPSKRLSVGAVFSQAEDEFTGTVLAKNEDGTALVHLQAHSGESVLQLARRLGAVPLPPYIHREKNEAAPTREADLDRYQTVYADTAHPVAVAAPTAGLHFTPELLATLAAHGVSLADLTLHVGLGTFKPITAQNVEEHKIHREVYEIPRQTIQKLRSHTTGRRIAVGTTTLRSIEHYLGKAAHENSQPESAHIAEADLFIYPPARFRGVDSLLTNFHQPRSTLLCLVAAFLTPGSTAGIAWLHEIYAEAVAQKYRFFSYGDAMLIL